MNERNPPGWTFAHESTDPIEGKRDFRQNSSRRLRGGSMGIVQVNLPEDLRSTIDRQVAGGVAASEADYVASALRLYTNHLDAEDEISLTAEPAGADFAAGRFVTVSIPEDSEALHAAAMVRLR